MEKEGFVRAVTDLKSKDINIKTLVTDRHPQIQKYAREQMPNTDHEYDSWHVVKGRESVNYSAPYFIMLLRFKVCTLFE